MVWIRWAHDPHLQLTLLKCLKLTVYGAEQCPTYMSTLLILGTSDHAVGLGNIPRTDYKFLNLSLLFRRCYFVYQEVQETGLVFFSHFKVVIYLFPCSGVVSPRTFRRYCISAGFGANIYASYTVNSLAALH